MIQAQCAMRSVSVDVSTTSWANASTGQPPIGIAFDNDAVITGALAHDSAETSWTLSAGIHGLSFRSINTSSTTKTGIHVLYAV